MMEQEKIDQKFFERIEAYLDQRMDREERVAFEIKIKAEPELAEEVRLQSTLRDSIASGAFQDNLDEIHAELFPNQVTNKAPGGVSLWKIAAGVAFILGIGALFYTSESAHEKLYADYATTDPGLPVTMGVTDEYTFSDGMVSYKEGNYRVALKTWESITSNDIASDKLSYYKACAHFNLEEYEQALPYLTSLVNDPQSDFHDKAVWYACLSYLQLQDDQQIQSLSPSEVSPYYDRIEAIKQELSQ